MDTRKKISLFSIGYILIFGFSYIILPLFFFKASTQTIFLAELTFLSIIFYLIGLNVGSGLKFRKKVFVLNFNKIINLFFIIFLLIVLLIIVTAKNVPLIALIKGANSADLIIFRENFLKARVGWEASLNYVISIINSSFIPYLIATSFLIKQKNRFVYAVIFLLYCISFLEKAYFLKLAIPFFFIYFFTVKNKFKFAIKGLSITTLLLASMFFLTGSGTNGAVSNYGSFFSINYISSGTFETLFWRALVVPVATALDGLKVFENNFHNEFFYGATSSFISFVAGMPRVNFERVLYQEQFGGIETGNANHLFIVEAFVNFGIIGVVLFSFFVGKIVRFCILKRDIALISVLPLFLYNIFNAGLIGTLLGGGFLFFLLFINNVKFNYKIMHE